MPPVALPAPTIEILRTGELPEQRGRHIEEWFDTQFANSGYRWGVPDWRATASVGDEIVTHVGIVERRIISVGDAVVAVAGIGGVMTRPHWRGRGMATVALEQCLRFIADELQAAFVLLLCRQEVSRLYAGLGWRRVDGPTTFEQPAGATVYPWLTMVRPCGEQAFPPGPIDLHGFPW